MHHSDSDGGQPASECDIGRASGCACPRMPPGPRGQGHWYDWKHKSVVSLWIRASQVLVMKMHDVLDIKEVVQRDSMNKSLSLDATLWLKTIVHFNGHAKNMLCSSEWVVGTYQRCASRYSSLTMALSPSSFQLRAVICVSSRFCHCSGHSLWEWSNTTMSDGWSTRSAYRPSSSMR